MKLFGIMIAGGFSSEVSVGSRMLGNSPEVESLLAVHAADAAVPQAVERASKGQVLALDTGWRPNPDGTRSNWGKAWSWAKLASVIPEVVAKARRFAPDVIYSSQQRWDCSLASAVALSLGKPQVVHLHYVPGPWLGRLAQRRLKTVPLVVTVSEFTRRQVIEHGAAPERVTTVLNSITLRPAEPDARANLRAAWGFAGEERVVGNIARFSATKGQREIIDAFAALAPSTPHARLVLVGDGLIRAELEQQAQQLGLKDKVLFTGPRSDISACLAAFDVFTHPSYLDPCPLAVLEAQAAGVPVVAFEDGGIPEIVAHEETGLLSPVRNVERLSLDMKRLLEDVELARRMGTAAKERAERLFNEPLAGQRFTQTLRELLARS